MKCHNVHLALGTLCRSIEHVSTINFHKTLTMVRLNFVVIYLIRSNSTYRLATSFPRPHQPCPDITCSHKPDA